MYKRARQLRNLFPQFLLKDLALKMRLLPHFLELSVCFYLQPLQPFLQSSAVYTIVFLELVNIGLQCFKSSTSFSPVHSMFFTCASLRVFTCCSTPSRRTSIFCCCLVWPASRVDERAIQTQASLNGHALC